MKTAYILHNPNAGNGDQSKNEIIEVFEEKGIECGYSSTKDIKWKKVDADTDFLVVAGGDGTVRTVALELLQKKRFKKRLPILLLPMGTANNISKTLEIEGYEAEITDILDQKKVKKYDVGVVEGLKKKRDLIFLESFGCGVFPELMSRMKELPERADASREENIKTALQELHKIVLNYQPAAMKITVDGQEYDEPYLLAEVMNITSIGPNLNLSPESDPGDGQFEVVLVPESQRQELASFILYKINGIESEFRPQILKAREIVFETNGGLMHTDDELYKTKKPRKITINPVWGMLEFFVQ